MKTDHIKTPPAAEKPLKRAARGPKTCEQSDKGKALQSKPQVVNQNGVTGLTVPEAKANAIAACLAQGFSVNRIVKELGTSCHTVTAIARNRPELVDQYREITRRNWQAVAMLATGELIDRVPNMKDQGLAVAAAIATEKMELLGGNATSRIEHSHKPSADEWQEMLVSIPEADARLIETRPAAPDHGQSGQMAALQAPVVEAEIVGTDVVTGNPGQPAPAKDAQDQGVTVSDDQSRHNESSVFEAANSVKPPVVSGLVSTEERLNELEIPFEDLASEGGRIPDGAKYGSWLRRNDPIAFEVDYQETNRA